MRVLFVALVVAAAALAFLPLERRAPQPKPLDEAQARRIATEQACRALVEAGIKRSCRVR